jgi:hypothetical protein
VLTVALVIQGAIWLRELILAMVEYRAGEGEGVERLGTAMGLIVLQMPKRYLPIFQK